MFYHYPESIDDANKLALSYCKRHDLTTLFHDLQKQRVPQKDLEEAIFSYNNRKYTSCALMLFSLIDAKLIKSQKKSKNGGYKLTGQSAVKNFQKRFESANDVNELTYHIFEYLNLLNCLATFFSNTVDFTQKFNVVNRHYIAHGMKKRAVRQRECIQLFLALYNLLDLFAMG